MKYVVHYRGFDTEEIQDADSVAVVLDDGSEIELRFRRSDGELSLSATRGGQLIIEPRASNTVRIKTRK